MKERSQKKRFEKNSNLDPTSDGRERKKFSCFLNSKRSGSRSDGKSNGFKLESNAKRKYHHFMHSTNFAGEKLERTVRTCLTENSRSIPETPKPIAKISLSTLHARRFENRMATNSIIRCSQIRIILERLSEG